jgi:hypothetical protein
MKFIVAGPEGKLIKLDTDKFLRKFMASPLGVALNVVDIVRDTGKSAADAPGNETACAGHAGKIGALTDK